MKKLLLTAVVLMFVICMASCSENSGKDDTGKSFVIFTKSDVVTQTSTKSRHKLITIDSIDEDGNCKVTGWTCIATNRREFEFEKDEQEHEDIIVDSQTQIEMGDIMNYDGETPLSLYNKVTGLKYFKLNATKKWNDKPLYFSVTLTNNHADKIMLYWDYYFKAIG